jgi:hypothetical protein
VYYEDVWEQMLSENSEAKLQHIYDEFAELVGSNSDRIGKHYKEVLQEFFNKMIINVTL